MTSPSALVIEGPNGGTDQLLTSVSYALAPGCFIETLATTNPNGTSSINLTGNEIAQTLIGNAGKNVIDGGSGADQLWGKAGADIFAFTASPSGGVDSVMDFNARDDLLVSTMTSFRPWSPGPWPRQLSTPGRPRTMPTTGSSSIR